MKKILIFSLAYYPHHVSGAEAAIKEITDRISDIQFHMITLRFGDAAREERVGNVMLHRIGFGPDSLSKMLFPVLAALEARRLHREYGFDALWAMMTYMLLPTVLAKMLGLDAPHILTLQDGDSYKKIFTRARIVPFLRLIDRGFRGAVAIQAISKHLAAWPAKRGYLDEVLVIHNGANPRDMNADYTPAEVDTLKDRLGKRAGDVFLVNTARLEDQKANDLTIHALSMLPENVKLLLVGEGTEESALRDLAQKLGHGERVIFTGKVPREQVTLYRKAADIFVGPSRSEGLGNAFLSAMASGLPVVATRQGGLAEFVFGAEEKEKQTAWVVAKNSSHDIANAVKDILARPDDVRKITERAREMVIHQFNWDDIAKEMHERFFVPVLHKSLVTHARALAEKAHANQIRKTDTTPYIQHPWAVAEMLAREDFSEVVVAAAWVHDVVEDAGVSILTVEQELGKEVATIVEALTEDKDLEWEARKQKYIDTVRAASDDAKAVSIADKIHNLTCLLEAHAKQGKAVWEKFNRGKDKKLWFEEAMLSMFKETWKHSLISEYERLIEKMRKLD